jgi:hypothetical protein
MTKDMTSHEDVRDDERALVRELAVLAKATEAAEAPARLRESVLTAFRARPRGAPRRSTGRLAGALATAATLAIAGGLLLARREGARVAPVPNAPATIAARAPAPPTIPATLPAKEVERPLPLRARRSAPAPSVVAAVEGAAFEGGAFLPVAYAASMEDLDSAPIVRMALPREALLAFGWPLSDETETRAVMADVVLGPDGVARAIRFVP